MKLEINYPILSNPITESDRNGHNQGPNRGRNKRLGDSRGIHELSRNCSLTSFN